MKKIWFLTTLLVAGLLLTGCNQTVIENPEIIDDCATVDWEDSCVVDAEEPVVEKFNMENFINWFSWTIIDWTDLETVEITQDETLYFNDKFWFAVVLWKEWNWWKIEVKVHNEQFWKNSIWRSIHFYKEWFEYDVYSLSIDKIEKYDTIKKQNVFWTEDEFEKWIKWKNNKYLFVGYANDQLYPHIDTTNEYQQLFLNWFVFYDVNGEFEENYKVCIHYFDWCNRCTMQDDWDYICTEEACEQYQKPYCWDEQYDQFLEDIKSSWEQPQRINDYPEEENILVIEEENMNTDNIINLKIWNKTLDVTLEENSATKALIEKLQEWDIVINAREYWWFEKVGNLGFDLPRADKQITTEPGDLVLYQWNQISLFYENNSWSYTKLWKVQMISKDGLKEILWDWDVTLVFSLLK
jgi:hypothetical protein